MTTVNQHLTRHIGLFKENVAKQAEIERKKKELKDKQAAEAKAKKEAEESQTMEVTEEEAALIQAQE